MIKKGEETIRMYKRSGRTKEARELKARIDEAK